MNNSHNSTIPCFYCKYEANSINATKCRICGKSLNSKPLTLTKIKPEPNQIEQSKSTLRVQSSGSLAVLQSLLIILLAILIGGGIFLYQNRDILTFLREEEQTQTKNAFSETKLYSTLKQVPNVPQGLFWYGSSLAFAPLHTPEITQALTQAQPKFKIQYKEPPLYAKPGSTTGLNMLIDGLVSFTELSRPIKDLEYARAKQRGVKLLQVPIASDGVVVFVNPSLPVEKLSINQVRDMILGKITNWNQVNGPDLPVQPFVFNPKVAPATLLLLFEHPELTKFGNSTQFVRDSTESIRKVNSTPGGLGMISAASVVNQQSVRPLLLTEGDSQAYVNPFAVDPFTKERKINSAAFKDGSYPLIRRLFIVIRQDGTIDELAGRAYANLLLSKEGQQLVETANFVPIR